MLGSQYLLMRRMVQSVVAAYYGHDKAGTAQVDAEYKVKWTPTRHTKKPSTAKLPLVAAIPVKFA